MFKKVLSYPYHYVRRLWRWLIILRQVRGATVSDQWTLVKSALAGIFLSARNLHQWQDPILLDDAEVTVAGIGRFSLRKRCDDLWHVSPVREQSIVDELRKHLRFGDVFVDAGANIGFYTVLAAKLVGEAGRVIAIEMMPDTSLRLQHHIELNQAQTVSVERYALYKTSGDLISVRVDPEKFGQASIAHQFSDTVGNRSDVETRTLDEICEGIGEIRLMKMDLEGAEIDAIAGGQLALKRMEYVIFESRQRDEHADEVVTAMRKARYVLTRIDGNNQIGQNQSAESAFA